MKTIKEYAQESGVSYESVRQQVRRYSAELKGHIITKGRTRYLDETAMSILDNHHGQNREDLDIVQIDSKEVTDLQKQIINLQKQIIDLQTRESEMIAISAQYQLLLEDQKQKQTIIESKDQTIADLTAELQTVTETNKVLTEEAASYHKSIFGFYRKK